MKRILKLSLPFIAGLALISCHKDDPAPSMKVRVSAGTETGSVRLLLSLDAPEKNGYTLDYTFYSYDIPTSSRTPLIGQTMSLAGEDAAADGADYERRIENVSFPGGRQTFVTKGLEVGTYQVEISAVRENTRLSAAAVFVLTPEGVKQNEEENDNGNGNGEENNEGNNEGNGEGNGNGNGQNDPPKTEVTDFSLPGVDPAYGSYCMKMGQPLVILPEFTPADATPDWKASCSNPDVASVDVSNGNITVTPLRPGRTTLVVSCGDVVKNLPLLIYQEVTIKTYFVEDTPSDYQLATKTVPVDLRFEPSVYILYDTAISFTVSMKAVVTRSNHDVQEVSDKSTVKLNGDRYASYNIDNNILLPAWSAAGRTTDFNLSLSLDVQRNNPLDPAIWRITFDDAYKTQNAWISQYITSGLQ